MGYSVYALIDPRNDAVRYIGMSKHPYQRFGQHLTQVESNAAKNEWLQELSLLRLIPTIQLIEEVESKSIAKSRENYWIEYYVQLGCALVNAQFPKGISTPDTKRKVFSYTYLAWQVNDVTPLEKLVLLALADYADHHRDHPTIAMLAIRTNQGERTVTRCLKSLEGKGYVGIVRGTGKSHSDYTLTLPKQLLAEYDATQCKKQQGWVGKGKEDTVISHLDQF